MQRTMPGFTAEAVFEVRVLDRPYTTSEPRVGPTEGVTVQGLRGCGFGVGLLLLAATVKVLPQLWAAGAAVVAGECF